MSQKSQAEIPGHTYRHYRPFIWLFRLIGLFPVTIQKTTTHAFLLTFSPLLIVLGFIFGISAIFMAYWGIFLDVTGEKADSVRVASDIDRLVFLNDVTCYCLVFLGGVFLNPSRFTSFFTYIKQINQVDSLIKTHFKQSEKYKMVVVLSAIIALNTYLGWIDMRDSYTILGGKIGLAGVLERFIGIDMVAYTANIIEYTNQILLNGLEKRIRRLNELLNMLTKSRLQTSEAGGENIRLGRLTKAYDALMDAADALNNFLGICTTLMVVAVLWGLIEWSYFLLAGLAKKRGELRDAIEIPRSASLFLFHVFRMLLITEPCYSCLVQMDETKRLACRLMTFDVGNRYQKQTKRFALMVGLRQLQFTGCGFFVVDRLLFTSLLDAIVTLLCVLLQYQDDIEIQF